MDDHAATINANACNDGGEMSEMKSDFLRRHNLRATDPSLKEFTNKLKAAHILRDQQQQMLLNEYHRLQDKAAEQTADFVTKQANNDAIELTKLEQKENVQRELMYRQQVLQQCTDNNLSRQHRLEDQLIDEKKMMKDNMAAIIDSEAIDMRKKRERWMQCRCERAEAEQAQVAGRQAAEAEALQEARGIEQQAQTIATRNFTLNAEKREKDLKRDEIHEILAAQLNTIEAGRHRREELIEHLQHQEYEERAMRYDVAEHENSERIKREDREEFTRLADYRKAASDKQVAEDGSYRKMLDARLCACQSEDRERQLEVRERNQQYAQELQQQIRENESRRQREAQ